MRNWDGVVIDPTTCVHHDLMKVMVDTGKRKCYDCDTVLDFKAESTPEETPDWFSFVMRVLKVTSMFPDGLCEDLWWRTDSNYAPVTFLVNCNDTFHWATSDCERLTPANLHLLEEALAELNATGVDGAAYIWGAALFCAKSRKMRPMRAAYPGAGAFKVIELFDACGPERDPKTEG